jgi:flagellar assembly protein FliH
MPVTKSVTFPARLKNVTIESVGKAPIGGESLQAVIDESYKNGYQAASDKFNAQILEMRREMQGHAQGVLKKMEETLSGLEEGMLRGLPELITAGVLKIVGEFLKEPELLRARVEALAKESCPANEPVEVSLNIEDINAMKLIDENYITNNKRFTFKIDETLQPGDCVMKTKFGVVDATLKTQLKRLLQEMSVV